MIDSTSIFYRQSILNNCKSRVGHVQYISSVNQEHREPYCICISEGQAEEENVTICSSANESDGRNHEVEKETINKNLRFFSLR